ncbi:MAG: hypothetical protein HY913_12280 [Desulfomonile tiedjei]|nr:hypothetical protein [Desulfomonile tiedjei]
MSEKEAPWSEDILNSMKPGAVTFAWDDGEIRTIPAPEKALDTMADAWKWIDEKLKELGLEKGKPRSVCFRLTNGQFRGLKFPDVQPGAI